MTDGWKWGGEVKEWFMGMLNMIFSNNAGLS